MRQTPTVVPVHNSNFEQQDPSIDSIRDVINRSDNIFKLYEVETVNAKTLTTSFSFVGPLSAMTMNTVEVVITDELGLIDRHFKFSAAHPEQVRVVSKRHSVETRIILLLNDEFSKGNNNSYYVKELTPEIIAVVNAVVEERLCQQ